MKSLIISYKESLEVLLSEMMKSKCNVGLTVLSFYFRAFCSGFALVLETIAAKIIK